MKYLLSITIIMCLGLSQNRKDITRNVNGEISDGVKAASDRIQDGVFLGVKTAIYIVDDLQQDSYEQNIEYKQVEEDQENENVSSDEFTFREDVTIDSGEVSKNNMRIIGGDLIINGTINGVVTLLGGDAYLKNSSVLNGQIITIGGNVYREPNSTVNGKIIENNLKEGLIYRETDKEDVIQGTTEFEMNSRPERSHQSWIHPKRPILQYNRNEGLVLTPFNKAWDRNSKSNFRLNWSTGIRWRRGFAPDYTGRTTFEKSFFENQSLILYASLFKEARTDDGYRLPEDENRWANFLVRQDFYDRWDESGWETGIGFNIFRNIHIKGRFVSAKQDTLSVWKMASIFGKKRTLRPNLDLTPNSTNYNEMTLMARTPNYSPLKTGLAVFLQSEYIQTDSDTSTTFKMDYGDAVKRSLTFITFNWEFSEGLVFRSRLMVGSADEALPSHRLFSVGGLGSVSAQDFKLQQGNQLAQLNLALFLTPTFTEGDWLVSLFADGGRAWTAETWDLGWISDNPKLGISSAGIGLGHGDYDSDINWIINIAKSLDHDSSYETTLRANFSF